MASVLHVPCHIWLPGEIKPEDLQAVSDSQLTAVHILNVSFWIVRQGIRDHQQLCLVRINDHSPAFSFKDHVSEEILRMDGML